MLNQNDCKCNYNQVHADTPTKLLDVRYQKQLSELYYRPTNA